VRDHKIRIDAQPRRGGKLGTPGEYGRQTAKRFVNLYSFSLLVELFESVYRLTRASQARGCLTHSEGCDRVDSVLLARRVDPAELGPHNSRFYYDIVLENGSNGRGVCKHVTSLPSFQSTID